jgi:hypothetical protein
MEVAFDGESQTKGVAFEQGSETRAVSLFCRATNVRGRFRPLWHSRWADQLDPQSGFAALKQRGLRISHSDTGTAGAAHLPSSRTGAAGFGLWATWAAAC